MKDIDKYLKENITADITPDASLNSKILECTKETSFMKNEKYKVKIAVASMVGFLMIGSVSVSAAYHFLSPAQVVQELTESKNLSKAFDSEDAVYINETQNVSGYDVTLMGTVTGADLLQYTDEEQDISDSKTYAVVAIEKEDGSPMPEETEVFCLTPLIHGKSFSEVSVGSLNGGVCAFVQDGIQYELLECDDLEIFADMGVELGVIKNYADGFDAFNYDDATGNYSRNNDYDGLNALFELPLDKSKANKEAAKAFFASLDEKSASEVSNDLTYCEEIDYLLNLSTEDSVLSTENIEKIINMGTLLVDKEVEEENGKFHISWSNEQETVDEEDDVSIYVENQPNLYFASVSDGDSEGEYTITAQYTCMKNGILNVKEISYNWNQVKEIYELLK